MRFEILGEISGVETFATGSKIREIARLRKIYGRGRWRKRKASLAFDYRTAASTWQNYTGTKHPESAAKN